MAARTPLGLTGDVHAHPFTDFATYDAEGRNSRLMDCLNALSEVAALTLAAGGKTIILGGDCLHSRSDIDVVTLYLVAKAIRDIQQTGVRVLGMLGNHDKSRDGKFNSMEALPFDDVITEPGVYENHKLLPGYRVGFIPWTESAQTVRDIASVKKLDFVVGHFGVCGSLVGPSSWEIPGHISVEDIAGSLSKRVNSPVFLFHYHKPQILSNTRAMYVGSPLQLSWGETGDTKGFVLFNPDGTHAWKPLPRYPRFVRVTEAELAKCRKQDFVELIVDKPDDIERARNVVKRARPTTQIRVADTVELEVDRTITLPKRGDVLTPFVKRHPLASVSPQDLVKYGHALLGETNE